MSNFEQFLIRALLLVPAVLIAIPVHEMGHAAAAYFLGDRSVRYFGYFRPDPRRFLEPVGVIAVAVALVASAALQRDRPRDAAAAAVLPDYVYDLPYHDRLD